MAIYEPMQSGGESVKRTGIPRPIYYPDVAKRIAAKVDENFPTVSYQNRMLRQTVAIAEEAGEVAGAMRRYLGLARRNGSLEEVAEELSDLLITLYVAAYRLGIDLDMAAAQKVDIMFERGWKDPR